jgi:hypothetical protein
LAMVSTWSKIVFKLGVHFPVEAMKEEV